MFRIALTTYTIPQAKFGQATGSSLHLLKWLFIFITCGKYNLINNEYDLATKMALQFKVIVFIIVSIGFAWLTRASLYNYKSHGFYRFFAFEAIVVLVLINIDYWFLEAFSLQQRISWSLLIICTYLVIHGAYLLRMVGKPDRTRNDTSLMSIEKTSELVTIGAYRYIRHPLYSSLLFLAWGAFFKQLSFLGFCLGLIATFFLIMTAKAEEIENIKFFGDAYRGYRKQTKMFVPFLF